MGERTEEDQRTRCALCRQEKELCESHIIPEFMYRPGYDEKHRTIRVEAETGRRKYVQKGYTEPLLCRACEDFFNEAYEKPYHEGWYHRDLLPDPPPDTEMTVLSGLNYGPVKLFHLLVLWRASVARGRALEPVDLGPHEEPIRQKLLKDNPGDPHEYPVIGIALTQEGELAHGLIAGPAMWKHEAMRIYSMIYGGFEWGVGVASHCPQGIRKLALQRDGTMKVPVRPWTSSPFVQKVWRRNVEERGKWED